MYSRCQWLNPCCKYGFFLLLVDTPFFIFLFISPGFLGEKDICVNRIRKVVDVLSFCVILNSFLSSQSSFTTILLSYSTVKH